MSRFVLPQVSPGDRVTHEVAGTDIVIEDLPKVSLHDHLDGGVRPATIVELAGEAGIQLPATEALGEWFRTQADSGSLVDYLQTFDVTLAVMQTAENLERIAREFVLDLAADGVIYGEIRWAPELHGEQGLSLDDAVEAVQRGIVAGCAEATDGGHPIRIGQLLCAMRQADRADEIAELAIRHRGRGVVGFDLAGPEQGFPVSRLASAIEKLDAEWMPRTIHAGEADGLDSIRDALLDGRALRLGHGVRISDDIDVDGDSHMYRVTLGALAEWVRDRGIALELCPTSNLQTDAFARFGNELEDHPFDLLYQLGFRVTVSTDNRLMSGTTLSRELAILSEVFGYGVDDILEFQLNAAESAFLPADERSELVAAISRGFDSV
ncbi:MAG: adenosine deaminase [Microbacteriaceae bacterium]